jgi:ERCC4-type nuclease
MPRSEPIRIVIDSREQRPYRYPGAVVKALNAGDYSVEGAEHLVAIERKSKSDAFNSLGRNRGRFEREVQRLAELRYAAIVIESTLADFLRTPAFSQMSARAAARSLLTWSVKYRLPMFWAGDRRHGRAVTMRLLEAFVRYERGDRPPGSLVLPSLDFVGAPR